MPKITVNEPSSPKQDPTSDLENGLEELLQFARDESERALQNIILAASGLIDNSGAVSKESLSRVRAELLQTEKNLSASLDVIAGVNLFLQTTKLEAEAPQ